MTHATGHTPPPPGENPGTTPIWAMTETQKETLIDQLKREGARPEFWAAP